MGHRTLDIVVGGIINYLGLKGMFLESQAKSHLSNYHIGDHVLYRGSLSLKWDVFCNI